MATRTENLSWRKRCKVLSRCAWAISPCKTSVETLFPNDAVTSSASRFVCVNTMVLLPFACTVTKSINTAHFDGNATEQDIKSISLLIFPVSSPTKSIFTWSTKNFCCNFFTQCGIVALNKNVCLFFGTSSKIVSTSSSNPTASI